MKKLFILLHLFMAVVIQAQTRLNWQASYGGNAADELRDILPLSDNGYLLAGSSKSDSGDIIGAHGERDYWIIRTGATGQVIWKKNYGGSQVDIPTTVCAAPGGGFMVAGLSSSEDGDITAPQSAGNFLDVWLIKIDENGNLLWNRNFGGSNHDQLNHMIPVADGFVFSGTSLSSDMDLTANYGDEDAWIFKTDFSGNIIWQKNYGGTGRDIALKIRETADGGFIFCGYTYSADTDIANNYGAGDAWVVKTDATGNIIWSKNYGGESFDAADNLLPTADGGYIVNASSYSLSGDIQQNFGDRDAWIFKLDASGNLVWSKNYGGAGVDISTDITEIPDGSYMVTGFTTTNELGQTIPYDAFFLKVHPSGTFISSNLYGSPGDERGRVVRMANDGGLIAGCSAYGNGGDITRPNQGDSDYWLIKLDLIAAQTEGTVTLDFNGNCVQDTNDILMPGIIVYATDVVTGTQSFNLTDTDGHYFLETDTTYQWINGVVPSPYYTFAACSPSPQVAELSSLATKDTVNFFLEPVVECPYLTVDIGTGLLRRCSTTVYHIYYCNTGTAPAADAYVTVAFDRTLTVTGSSIPWTTVSGNTYTFPVGDLDIFECAEFTVTALVDCDSTFIRQTACVVAHIFPDSLCLETPDWNGAELRASAACIGTDSVLLTLKNIGPGDMPAAVEFLVIEDIIMKNGGTIQLNSQQTATWTIPVEGLSQRITARQPETHPFKTYTTAAVNLCKTENLPPVPGPIEDFMTVYPEDEEAPYEAIDCQPIMAAFDPNDKTVSPAGRGPEGYIAAGTELTYKIRFQNTGNDTAFTVVLVDTIAQELDMTTLQQGASSHPYRMELSGQRVVKFIFEQILLPDSSTNNAGSQGFVQFTIRQKPGNTDGVQITNAANIYFDFNPPVLTNTVVNTIGEIYLEETVTSAEATAEGIVVNVFPNPAHDRMTFQLPGQVDGFDLLLFDVTGKLVQQICATGHTAQLYRNSLPDGLYWFHIRTGNHEISTGKLLFR